MPAPLSGHQGNEDMGYTGGGRFHIFLSGGCLGT